MAAVQATVDRVRSIEVDAYKYGFISDIESDKAPKGLNEDIVRFISAKKHEPEWLLAWRLEAYGRRWKRRGGRGSNTPKSTIRISIISPRPNRRPRPSRSTRSIPSCSRSTP